MTTIRMTMAQALIRFLANQFTERDGEERPFFGGCFGIFGHGNVAGVGQALQEHPEFPYYQARNEQAMVHAAAGFAKMNNRLRAMACTSSIGPGATNMITAAAGATINRLPVLLLPGDFFARRNVAPVLQQLEQPYAQDLSVNDCFKPVSKYWDRISRPDQLLTSLPEALRVLTSPVETGTVTLALPQDVQTEAMDYPESFFRRRVWHVPRPRPETVQLEKAIAWLRQSRRPLIIAGGGVIYSQATDALATMIEATGIPVGVTQAGKAALPSDHPQAVGAVGVTGTPGANRLARECDLVIGIGTRYTDFTTASQTGFQSPDVRFINLNIGPFDSHKLAGLSLAADARAGLEALVQGMGGWTIEAAYRQEIAAHRAEWEAETNRLFNLGHGPPVSQSEIIGAVNSAAGPHDVVVCAAGSLPGDLHKLWRVTDPQGYHLEYGYSCMGYEIAGGIGVKLADPSREVYVMVGDASYLMMSSEIVTSIQEALKLTIVVIDNHGFSSISGLSESIGSQGFGTHYRYRDPATGQLDGRLLPIDFAANAKSLGALALQATDIPSLEEALAEAKQADRTAVIVIEADLDRRVGGYESWWDVPVAEVSQDPLVVEARKLYEAARKDERHF